MDRRVPALGQVRMSEYQYYEFLAIDKPLTDAQRAELRKLSSRAEITSTRFTNEYSFGDFQGQPEKLMERYFDAFLYVANWGTRRLMFRLRCESVSMSAHLRSPVLPRGGPGLIALPRAGLTFHGHLHPRGCLTVGSASVWDLRATPGDLPPAVDGEVTCRVDVPVKDQAAGGACVGSLGKGELGFHRATARAPFT